MRRDVPDGRSGGAATLQALASYPELETLDCVEINKGVVEGAGYFSESSVLEDHRVTVVVDDAVHHLLSCHTQYDLIVSDGKQHPFFSGNAALLCREFYEYALSRLNEQGLFVQWVPLLTLGIDLEVILRTLCDSFPHVEVFYFPEDSVFMVGSRQPLAGRPRMSDARYLNSRASQDLTRYFIDNLPALLSCQVAGKHQLQQVLGDGPISTWDRMILDSTPYKAPVEEMARARLDNLSLLLAAEEVARPGTDPSLDLGDSPYITSSNLLRRAYMQYFTGNLDSAYVLMQQAAQVNPKDKYVQAAIRFLQMITAQQGRQSGGG